MRKRADIVAKPGGGKSALHRAVVAAVKAAYPQMTVTEEATIEGRTGKLYVDILIRELRVCIECHGRQHFEYVPHFHGSREAFDRAARRDAEKARAIADAGHVLVVVPHTDEGKLTPDHIGRLVLAALRDRSSS